MASLKKWGFEALRRLKEAIAKRPPISVEDEKLEEEALEEYDPDRYYQTKYGDVLGGRYGILAKLGYGGYSTVWLAKDFSVPELQFRGKSLRR